MSDLSPEAGSLVQAAREEAGLSPAERSRLRGHVLSAAGAGAFTAAGTVATSAAAKVFGLSAVSWLAVAGSLAVGGAGAYYYSLNRVQPLPPVQVAQLPPPVAPRERDQPPVVPSALPEQPQALAAPAESSPHPTNSRSSEAKPRAALATPSVDTGFSEDARLLRDVRAALSAGQNARALDLLEARKLSGVKGVLDEEREAARIVTLCKLGRESEARAAAGRFLAAHPSSPLAERVRRACPPAGRDGSDR